MLKNQPLDILNKFTYHFKKVLINAQNLAFTKKSGQIEPADLLSSLLTTKGALGSDILTKQNINQEFFVVKRSDNPSASIDIDPANLPQPSVLAQAIIEKAVVAAYKFQHQYVGTEHLLWGLANSKDEGTNELFRQANINLSNLRQHLNLVLKSTSKFSDLTSEDTAQELEKLIEDNVDEGSALHNFTINLTSTEIQKDIDPVIGRQKEIDRLIEILSRRTKNNPVLLGDAGVGKTAIIEGLAKRIMEGQVPDVLLNKTILNLDIPGLIAGTMYRGEFENRLKQVISEIKSDPNIILYIDELHTIMGAGATAGSLDAANILKPALARGQLHCIGATTFEEYKKHIESDRALERRFQAIVINESSEAETYEILQGIKSNYEKFHRVVISDEAIQAAVTLSKRFLPDKKLPDKAIDLIDEAAARLRVQNTKRSLAKKIKLVQEQINNSQQNKKQAILAEDYLAALQYRDQEEKYIEDLLRLQAQEDKQQQAKHGQIDAPHIQEIISGMTGVPVLALTTDENKRLLHLEKYLGQHIFGQTKALNTIANTIRQAKAGLSDKNKPLASFIFLGPSGVGKTETAKQLAQYIFGGTHNLLRLDMSEFSEGFNISKLIGAPAGYVGYKEGNKLTDIVKNKPYTLILFDEIEKAHPDVFNLLLPILEEGELTDATGRTVNFRNCVIIMTSNIGLAEFNQQATLGFATEETDNAKNKFATVSKQIVSSLPNYIPPEFINRLNNVLVFEPIDQTAGKKIVQQAVNRLISTLAEQNIELQIDTRVSTWLIKNHSNLKEGARGLKRLIDERLANPIASHLLDKKSDKIKVGLIKNKITIQ